MLLRVIIVLKRYSMTESFIFESSGVILALIATTISVLLICSRSAAFHCVVYDV